MSEVIGRVGIDPRHPGRVVLLRPDGSISNWFGRDENLQDVARVLAEHGLKLLDDGSVEQS